MNQGKQYVINQELLFVILFQRYDYTFSKLGRVGAHEPV